MLDLPLFWTLPACPRMLSTERNTFWRNNRVHPSNIYKCYVKFICDLSSTKQFILNVKKTLTLDCTDAFSAVNVSICGKNNLNLDRREFISILFWIFQHLSAYYNEKKPEKRKTHSVKQISKSTPESGKCIIIINYCHTNQQQTVHKIQKIYLCNL